MQSMYSQYFVKIERNLSEIVWFEQIFVLQYFREDLFLEMAAEGKIL